MKLSFLLSRNHAVWEVKLVAKNNTGIPIPFYVTKYMTNTT